MAVSYGPYFAWLPKRLTNGEWAWLRTIQRIRHGGKYTFRDYIK